MARFFFHLHDSDMPVIDEEGLDFESDRAAIDHGIWCTRQVIASDIAAGSPVCLHSFMTITDHRGHELRRLSYGDAIVLLDSACSSQCGSAGAQGNMEYGARLVPV